MTNRNIATSQVDYTAVEFNLFGVNKSTSSDYQKLGTIKMLVPNVHPDNTYKVTKKDIEGATEAKLIEELRSHINPVLGLIKDYTDGLEISPRNLRNGVDAFLRTSAYALSFNSYQDVSTLQQVKAHVEDNPNYEELIQKILTYIVVTHKQEILKYAVNKERAVAEGKAGTPIPEGNGLFKITALRLDSKRFPEPLIFDVMTGYVKDKVTYSDTAINRFMKAFDEYKNKTSSNWQKNAISASMNHEARKTYAQQLIDLEGLARFLKSNELTLTEVHRIPLPHYEREFSKLEFDAACGNLRKMFSRSNAIKFAELFSYWQMYNGTRHPDGVMH